MKTLTGLIAAMVLAGCSGMETSGASGTERTGSSAQDEDLRIYQHPQPGDIYFGS